MILWTIYRVVYETGSNSNICSVKDKKMVEEKVQWYNEKFFYELIFFISTIMQQKSAIALFLNKNMYLHK